MADPFAPDDPWHIGLEWVRARLAHDPRTRPLAVSARAQGSTLVLEGRVHALADKRVAGAVARASQREGYLDNRIEVVEAPAATGRRLRPEPVRARAC